MDLKVLSFQTPISEYRALSSVLYRMERKMNSVNPDAVVMPEKWLNMVLVENSPEYDAVLGRFREMSSSYSCVLIPGSFAIIRESGLYNSSPVFYHGDLLGFQDKITLFGRENSEFKGGEIVRVFSAGRLNFGVTVCYDLDFPYFAKIQVRSGAEILFNPSLILKPYHKMWHLYVKLRSLENRVPIVSVNSMSPPLGGDSISTFMLQEDLAVILKYSNARMKASILSEIDIDSHKAMIKKRMIEDPGQYSLNYCLS